MRDFTLICGYTEMLWGWSKGNIIAKENVKTQSSGNMLNTKFWIAKWEVGKSYVSYCWWQGDKIKRYLIDLHTFILFIWVYLFCLSAYIYSHFQSGCLCLALGLNLHRWIFLLLRALILSSEYLRSPRETHSYINLPIWRVWWALCHNMNKSIWEHEFRRQESKFIN